MPDIRRLDEATQERIAAGEVVERPASVVKELVENSIDADASRVTVAVEDGGKEGVRVSDDGVGMTEEEVRKAVREHTTSKIRDIDDLESGVGTLGFRGEALHALGAVSRMTIRTRPRDGGRGTELVVEGGEVTDVGPVGCPEGTTVEVEDLFFNVPARRKYLKQTGTEFSHVNGVVAGYALANPGVAVTLEHGDRETFATTGDGDLRAAVMAVYGREVAASMIPVGERRGDDAVADGPLDGVSGLVSHPETNRASRDYVNTFVDGRYVTASAVRDAVREAYGRQLASDRHPFAVVSLDVPPGTVDVNVHPRKLEVRFADEDGVREQVEATVEEALLDEGLLRSSAPRGRSQADETAVEPESSEGDRDVTGSDAPERTTAPSHSSKSSARPAAATEASETGSGAGTETGGEGRGESAPAWTPPSSGTDDPHDASASGRTGDVRAEPEQTTLDGERALGEERFDALPSMRVLGQVHDTYVVAETPDGLVVVDQHAADERVRYERLRERFDGDVTTQALASPVEVSLTPDEAELVREHGDALARLGYRVDLDGETARVTTVPAPLSDAGADLAREVLGAFVDGDPEGTVAERVDELLGDLACKPAITGNESLTEGSVVDLLDALDGCENPWACPHGRPVVVEFSEGEIEERFERDYPGHE